MSANTDSWKKFIFLTLKTLDSWNLYKNRKCRFMRYGSVTTNFKSFQYPSRELWIFSHCCAKLLTTTKIFILSLFNTPHCFGHPPSMSYHSPLLFYVDNLITHLWWRSKHDKDNCKWNLIWQFSGEFCIGKIWRQALSRCL